MKPDQVCHCALSILIVEDDQEAIELLSRLIGKRFPHSSLHLAANGHRAVELFKEHRPDLVITDINMPVMDGIEMAETIKALDPGIQIIAITAKSDTHYLLNAIKIGINRYVLKPIEIGNLFEAVDDCVERIALNRQIKEQNDFIRKLSLAVEQSTNMIMIANSNGAIEYVNARFTKVAGYTSAEVSGFNLRALVTDWTSLDTFEMLWSKINHGLEWRGEFVQRRKGGALFYVEASIFPLASEDGRSRHFIAVMQDITERKLAEEQLRQSENRLKLFIDHAPAALAMFDRDMRYLYLSRRWSEDYGLEGRDLVGKSHYDVFPEMSDRWKEAHRRGLAGEVLRAEADRFERSDGSVQWLRWELRPWCDSKGQVAGIVIFSEDISARKESEGKIRRLNDELEQRVKERTVELESFCYSISHDLRAPLRGLNGLSGILQEDYADRLDETGNDYLKRIRSAAVEMGQLIDNLLNLSRVTRSTMRQEKVNLSALTGGIVKTLSEYEPEHKVEVSIEEGIEITCDYNFVRILLTNLLENAWKYTRKESRPRVAFGKILLEGEPAYFVRDNGVGFDMAHASHLYRPFHRLHGVREFEGNGIGLATAERIVSRHGGRIWAEGEVGKGAKFFFTLSDRNLGLLD